MAWWNSKKPESEPVIETRDDEDFHAPQNAALIIPSRNSAATAVSPGDALGMISVYRAVQIISTSVMQLSLDAFRDISQIDPRPLLLRQPDPDQSRASFLEQTALSLALNGNAYWRIFRDNQNRVTGLRVWNPADVVIDTDSFGNVTGYQNSQYSKPFSKTDVQHLSLARVPGSPYGRGPIQAAQQELHGAIQTRDYASFWFDTSGVPTGILSTSSPLSADQAARAQKDWTEANGAQAGIAVMGQGLTFTPIYLNPEDAQWISARQFDVTAIARLFGIPAGLMLASVEGDNETYSNISQMWTEFSRFTLTRYTVEIESAFSDLLPRGTDVRFNLEGLLRPDTTSRYALYASALTAGWMSINEVRALEGLEPAPDGDFKTAAQKLEAFQAAQQAPGPGDTTKPGESDD